MLVMINNDHKYIFIHIGKTGGTSVEHVLNPNVKLDTSKATPGTGNTAFKVKHLSLIHLTEHTSLRRSSEAGQRGKN